MCYLPIRHVLSTLDGKTKGPDRFAGLIGKKLKGSVLYWPVQNFKYIQNQNFPILSDEIMNNLSSYQYFTYKICLTEICGKINSY